MSFTIDLTYSELVLAACGVWSMHGDAMQNNSSKVSQFRVYVRFGASLGYVLANATEGYRAMLGVARNLKQANPAGPDYVRPYVIGEPEVAPGARYTPAALAFASSVLVPASQRVALSNKRPD